MRLRSQMMGSLKLEKSGTIESSRPSVLHRIKSYLRFLLALRITSRVVIANGICALRP
jgi:hypothetical protein